MANWFITGISRGFGRIMAEELLAQGHTVIGTTRDGRAPILHDRLTVFKLDVRDADQARAVLEEAVASTGGIDVLVNNAGYGLVGAVEEVSPAEAEAVIATNLIGTHNVIRAALPSMRAQRRGHIVNFSSVGGFAGSVGFGLYNASKFAVEGLSEALALELKPFGIGVTIVEPGYFRTEFLSADSAVKAAHSIEAYAQSAGQTRSNVSAHDGSQAGDPAKGVRAIIAAVESPEPPLRLPLGADCIARMEAKIAQLQADIATWRDVATATAFDS
ncbi:SDR family NAD(P)-dependent oxidoreductase [Novosphingobium terrae]|uniref:SDR family NAD(P)-dependent oxidoreductase n=1 Tax=Novosphingobium terrae TaxID=2726189 RepID=UPI00197E7139|nr:SDR family NAD(P)-dependent oxidoreductase [Novosphingobium terrae]